ncbi:MAG: YncE family protein [Bacteroidia bacterium]
MIKIFKYITYFFIVFAFSTCDKGPKKIEYAPVGSITENSILVCNEGNFNWSNASLSLVNTENNTVNFDVFFSQNNRKIGDVLQSATIINNKLYLVVNNSEKIEVVNPETFKHIATISGLKSPRYMVKVNNATAYVSDLYANAITIVDLNNHAVKGSIPIAGWTEEMLVQNNMAYITNLRKDFLLCVNTNTNTVFDTVFCGYGSNSLVQDKRNNIWILASGNETLQKTATLSCYNPQQKIITKQFIFNTGSPRKLIIDGKGETLFWLNRGNVFKMFIDDETLPANALINGAGKTFYGLDFYKNKNAIVVTDAKDYVQQGDVLIYDVFGKLLKQYKAGIIPSEICFYE